MTRKIYTTAAASTVLAIALATPAFAGEGNHFNKVDTNADAQVDFTEFYNYVSKHGYSDTDAAQEFVRLAGSDNVITSEGFAGYDAAKMKAKYAASGQPAYDATHTQSYDTANTQYDSGAVTTYRNDQMVVLGRTSVSGDFKSYDANSDGLVNYKEYEKVAKKNGVSSTAAAREFIQISSGQPQFDEAAFNMVQYTSAPSYEPAQDQYPSGAYVEPATPAYTDQTTTQYSSETPSGAYTAPSTTTYEGETTTTYENGKVPMTEPDTEYSSDTDSGAYTSDKTDVTVDPTTGVEGEYQVDTDVKDPMEKTWDKTKDTAKDALKETKDTASDVMDKAEDVVTPEE